jgi:epoxide hydrolase-like predicted phosphatase
MRRTREGSGDGGPGIRAVIFDIGGVIEFTPSTGSVARWESDLGLPTGAIDRRLAEVWTAGSIGRITEAEVHRAVREALKLDDERLHAFMDDLWQEYLGTLNEDLVDYIRGLRPRYRLGLLSNSFVGAREREEQRYSLHKIADAIVYSHEVGMMKPDPRVYLLACERLGVEAAEALFVDDTETALEGARRVGMQTVLFRNNAQAIAEIEALLRLDRARGRGSP